ncbi:hypothetical protein P153DRAFT_344544 [Dothidotthia symphoricarpi CBS 119687]|uniref:Rhodopsin domain-containing protein n=1 Tax=Dothidotthia symphoricarpi CBS 119687 TaxID=1392245 RepID=A0A6A6A8N4_9PLEO|nr:uncharacterized protein P153DRAFT_344544 [Dothidotthia symphoricarpi CBS 119687]KAF2127168.1 hypothetical protein P153DRAFT_344544 [Dothidotthia symphoricarpi CBS 119687]
MVNTGLQPVCLFIAIFPSALCVLIVSIRVWTRLKKRQYGIGEGHAPSHCNPSERRSVIHNMRMCHRPYLDDEGLCQLSTHSYVAHSNCYFASFLWTLIKLRSQNMWINRSLWATLILNICFAIAAPLVCTFQCDPVAKYWDNAIPGKCIDAGAYTVSTSSIVLATDVLILIMPTWILYNLKMPFARKLMVIAFLSFGVAVTIVGAVRTSVLINVFVLEKVGQDSTYEVGYTLSNIESGLAIIGVCGPTIKYILGCCIPALRAPEETSNHNYVYPPHGDSVGETRSRRYIKSTGPHDAFEELDKDPRSAQPIARRNTISDEHLMITKTVAWRVDNAQPDSNSTCEQKINTPRNMV